MDSKLWVKVAIVLVVVLVIGAIVCAIVLATSKKADHSISIDDLGENTMV